MRRFDRLMRLSLNEGDPSGIADQGTHDQLMDRCDIYQTYCRQQSVA
jgi:ABC-type multidrug transport system fused ATPase/permease subunit